jgi:Ricin-type beta-trefoil lectin domain-like
LGIARDSWRVWAVFYGTGDALGQSGSAVHPVTIKSGYRLMFRSSQKCLTTSNNGTANGTWLIQWTCNPNWDPWDGQTFSLYPVDPVGANRWQLRPNTANNPPYGQCVDVYGASTANGAPLNLYQCIPGAANQVWSFPALGSPNIGWFGAVATHSNKCMDVTAGNPANGVQIEQYECVWNGNQQFAWLVVP